MFHLPARRKTLAAVLTVFVIVTAWLAWPHIPGRLTFRPSALDSLGASPKAWGIPTGATVAMPTSDGEVLHGWWIPAHGTSTRCGSAIFFHGNMGNITDNRSVVSPLATRGLDVLLFDYRGYGGSTGTPDQAGLYADGRAAYNYVSHTLKIPADQIVLVGHSLGTAVALHVGAEHEVAAIILAGAFTSFQEAAISRLPWLPQWLVQWQGIQFSSRDAATKAVAPLLVLHAGEDRLIPQENARELFDAANPPKYWEVVLNVGHNEIFASNQSWAAIDELLTANGCHGGRGE